MKTIAVAVALVSAAAGTAQVADKLAFHNDAARSGWNPHERVLTPAAVASRRFGPIWQSPRLDGVGNVPARLYASPLYLSALVVTAGPLAGRRVATVIAVASTGYAYAITAAASGATPPGTIAWRARLTARPCDEGREGAISTPVIDRAAGRLYVTSCDSEMHWQLHALTLGSGAEVAGWPLTLDAAAINPVNRNGGNRFTDARTIIQRGALNLSADGRRLYLAIGPDSTGWLLSIDTEHPRAASAFSSTATDGEDQGGMWAAGGPSIDAEGRIAIATGSKFLARARVGVAGIYPDSAHDWGQSLLQFRDSANGLTLVATYSPFNYCQAGAADIDLGASGTVVVDVAAGTTPHLLAVGGKQGNFYLLDRDRLPGDTTQRHACSTDPDTDGSLLAPEPQPHFGMRGPINVFGPYSDYVSMLDQAKSRSTPAVFTDAAGITSFVVTGSAKAGDDFATSVPPGLARIAVETAAGRPAWPRLAAREMTQVFQNPGSPVVSSNGGNGAVIWVLDMNAPRSTPLYGARAPRPVLYAFDAMSLRLLWKSAPGVLQTSGKYNEPTVADGMVMVGTDRIQAFGLETVQPAAARPQRATASTRRAPTLRSAPVAAASGADIYRARCASCHGSNQPGPPNRAMLARMERARIEAALTTGVMRPMATGMTRAEVAAVARYVTD